MSLMTAPLIKTDLILSDVHMDFFITYIIFEAFIGNAKKQLLSFYKIKKMSNNF